MTSTCMYDYIIGIRNDFGPLLDPSGSATSIVDLLLYFIGWYKNKIFVDTIRHQAII